MNTAPCNCQSQTATHTVNERPRYYARQLVTPDDMTLEQDYFRAKLRRHNRYLHGWGVVCGANVVNASVAGKLSADKLIVKAGYVLGPYGDEICIEKDQCIDIGKKCTSSQPQVPDDFDCTEAQPPKPPTPPEQQRFVAIRYVEHKTRLVRVPLGGCGCEENTCEHSRLSDGYEICILDDCPDSHLRPPSFAATHDGHAPGCPECQTEPWVVLGAFRTVDGKLNVQECDCRRQVISFDEFWWKCVHADIVTSAGVDAGVVHPAAPTPTAPGPATAPPATPGSPPVA